MPHRKQQKVTVNGRTRWISGCTVQELVDCYVDLLEREGLIQRISLNEKPVPLFGDYLKTFVKTYKSKQADLTMDLRERIMKNHIIPRLGKRRISDITTTELQQWFNEMDPKFSKETILKIKNTMSPAFDAAVEEELISKNPLKSARIQIGGKETIHHKAIPKDTMTKIREALPTMPAPDCLMAALLSYTGMRFEEVLGFRWEDYDGDWLHVERVVVHPTRNLPVIKEPKTVTSKRQIPCPDGLKAILSRKGDGSSFSTQPSRQGDVPSVLVRPEQSAVPGQENASSTLAQPEQTTTKSKKSTKSTETSQPSHNKTGFVLCKKTDPTGETPLSYTEARRIFNRIRTRFGLKDYSAHDFRDTCATEWREAGIPLDVIARLLGHAKTETTERRYVKYRTEAFESYRNLM